MTLREQHQPNVDEFLSDLETYATGSYLREGEKQYWEQPFDPAALPELRSIIEGFLDAAEGADADDAFALATSFIGDLAAFNHRHGYAIIEPEEESQLADLIEAVLLSREVTADKIKELPGFE